MQKLLILGSKRGAGPLHDQKALHGPYGPEKHHASSAHCQYGHLSSSPSSLCASGKGAFCPRRELWSLVWLLACCAAFTAIFPYVLTFRSWENSDSCLCGTWFTPLPTDTGGNALCFASCWGSHRKNPTPLAQQLQQIS